MISEGSEAHGDNAGFKVQKLTRPRLAFLLGDMIAEKNDRFLADLVTNSTNRAKPAILPGAANGSLRLYAKRRKFGG
jgi:hypothetical protein